MDSGHLAARGRRFAAATPHSAATEAALAAFEAGGNAVDAALAANAVLAVVYPHMCGIGGDLFALVADSSTRAVVNGSGAAASALDAAAVRAERGSMPAEGPLTISVPGTVAAWDELARRFGRLPLAAATAPAIECAERGVPLAGSVAHAVVTHSGRLQADPGLSALFLPDGRPLEAGERLVQPELAATLRDIARSGSQAFYEGEVGARLIAGLARMGSPLTPGDLRRHTTEITAPLARPYRRLEVLVPPPNSQGFLLLEILGCIERGGLVADHLGAEAAVLARLFLLASADRDRFLADPRRVRVAVDRLLSGDHADELLAEAKAMAGRPVDGRRATGDTVGVVAAEEGGLWVSMNQSLYGVFGSGILEPETGIICHNRGSYFSLDPAAANHLVGGARPAHTLMPVMVLSDGRPVVASATMGGSAHAQIHAEVLTGIIDGRRDAWESIRNPRWLVGGLQRGGGSVVFAEGRVPGETIARLRSSGLEVQVLAPVDEQVGHAQLIARTDDGELAAASDPRADGAAGAA
jgi:gamma-glutamyltranspeptidase